MSRIKSVFRKAKIQEQNPTVSDQESLLSSVWHQGQTRSPSFVQTSVVAVPVRKLLNNRLVAVADRDAASDQIKLLRTRVFQHTRSKGWNVIQVTGPGSNEGKSLIAVNLAISIAMDTRQTTVLVDLNFRKPAVHQLLGLGPDLPGLKSYFLDETPLEDLFVSPGIKKLCVLPAGGSMPHPTELMGSPKMESLITELKGRYQDRYIIIDTPGINMCPDPVVISEYVDAVIMVARIGHTSQDAVGTAVNRLPREKILGVVLNDAPPNELPR